MDEQITMIAERIRGLRILLDLTLKDMADATDVAPEEYAQMETGGKDFSFTFLYKAARRFGVDITELVTGEGPKLSLYSYVPAGQGMPIERRKGFNYQHMAYLFKDKIGEPFVVEAKYDEDAPIPLSTHEGQEFDFVLEGELRMKVDDHEFTMKPGDAVYYNACHGHGMAAATPSGCKFLAIVMKYIDEKSK